VADIIIWDGKHTSWLIVRIRNDVFAPADLAINIWSNYFSQDAVFVGFDEMIWRMLSFPITVFADPMASFSGSQAIGIPAGEGATMNNVVAAIAMQRRKYRH
jgi:hypothetical protein